MTRQPPAVRNQAEHSSALWYSNMSPLDLKQLKAPVWIDPDRQGAPTLMLFSDVDDRSGVAYQEYRCVYGEDAETALRFLFNAMSRKIAEQSEADPLQDIPIAIYLDNGPVAKSAAFKRGMESPGVEVITPMPAGSDGRRTTARAKGKVERPFCTVKEAHETLYHFHEPATEEYVVESLADADAVLAIDETGVLKQSKVSCGVGRHWLEHSFVFNSVALSESMVGPSRAEPQSLGAQISPTWIAFARSGNPNNEVIPHWPAYTAANRTTMVFDTASRAVKDFREDGRKRVQTAGGKTPL